MENKIIFWLIATILSALAYRCGGMSKDADARPKWVPMFLRRSWVRDWGIPLIIYSYSLTLCHPAELVSWLALLLTAALTGAALSTYWDNVFGYDNYWFHGFMVGLAVFPLCFVGLHISVVLLRSIILAVLMGVYCSIEGTDWKEEMGRGAFIAATMPLLLF